MTEDEKEYVRDAMAHEDIDHVRRALERVNEEHERCNCAACNRERMYVVDRAPNLLAEIDRLRGAVTAWQDVAIGERNRAQGDPVEALNALWDAAQAAEALQ